jgi:hypothetical protein
MIVLFVFRPELQETSEEGQKKGLTHRVRTLAEARLLQMTFSFFRNSFGIISCHCLLHTWSHTTNSPLLLLTHSLTESINYSNDSNHAWNLGLRTNNDDSKSVQNCPPHADKVFSDRINSRARPKRMRED